MQVHLNTPGSVNGTETAQQLLRVRVRNQNLNEKVREYTWHFVSRRRDFLLSHTHLVAEMVGEKQPAVSCHRTAADFRAAQRLRRSDALNNFEV